MEIDMKDPTRTQALLNSLGTELDAFRAGNSSHARIPEALREAVLSAIDQGVNSSDVRKVLKIANSQIQAWRRARLHGDRLAVKTAEPRVLNVIPTPPSTGTSPNIRVSYENGRLLLEISL
jgi:hypothetical protein